MDIYGDMNPGDLNDTLVGTDDPDTIFGGQGDDSIDGGAGADSLDGGVGNDTITAGPTDEADTLVGGDGNDLYIVHGSSPTIVETATGGVDTIQSDADYINLNSYANVENAALTGSGGSSEVDGNALDNVLTTSTLANYGYLYGGDGADSLYLNDISSGYAYGGNGADSIAAYGSNGAQQQIFGDAGADTLDAEEARGSTSLYGGADGDTMTGGAGDDLYFVDSSGDVVVELPGGGTDTVKASVSTTLSANVEKLVLTASGLTGTGNDLANVISGTAGSDTLAGGLNSVAAGDTLQGGAGDDTYVVSNANDVVQEAAGGGTDTIRTGLAVYSLASASNVENLVYTGAAAFTGTGNTLGNAITSGAANDTLDGGAGADTLTGGGGDDTYYVDNGGDRVIEGAGGGNDTVYVSNSAFTLGVGQAVETLIAAGVLGVALHGNDLANHLIGNAAANLLDGGGGADTMEGGAGSDTYLVDDPGDVVIEGVGAGSDTVKTTLSAYTLTANVEALTFTGAGNFAGTGNASDNTLVGGVGDDTLDGSTGADRLVGELGNDVYYVDNTGDVILENPGEGTDTVHTTLSTYVLPSNVEVLHYDGVGTFNATGNALNNTLYADAATAATLHGAGGADTLYGGAGNDSLYGEGGSDVVYGGGGDDYFRTLTGQGPDSIYGGAGTDLLTLERTDAPSQLTVDLTLPGVQQVGDGSEFSGIEQIRFAGGLAGDFGRGGDLDDVLKGMGGDDTLIGGGGNDILQGGVGHDSLTGGLGADTFRFDGPVAGSDDTVTDFQSGVDKVALFHTGFGIASLADFDIVTAAGGPTEAKATLIVDTVAHTISWDADGTGAGAATLLAHGAFTTSAGDYLVF